MFFCCHRRGRLFQFGLKYWIGCSGTLIGVFILSQDIPSLREWNPLYVTFTMVVILSEKVSFLLSTFCLAVSSGHVAAPLSDHVLGALKRQLHCQSSGCA